MHARNNLQTQSNLDTWQFAYGTTVNITAPWGTSLSTDIRENSRRGYADKLMNTNELIWNAQLSQGFLKGNALTVSLQLYDILHNQTNFSRTVSAMSRSDIQYNSNQQLRHAPRHLPPQSLRRQAGKEWHERSRTARTGTTGQNGPAALWHAPGNGRQTAAPILIKTRPEFII